MDLVTWTPKTEPALMRASLLRLHRRAGESRPLRRIDFRHVIESLRRKPRALLRAQLQSDLLPGENRRQLWRLLMAALPPDEAAKVSVDALHVAARTDDLDAWERYRRRQFRRVELNLTPCAITIACGTPGPGGHAPARHPRTHPQQLCRTPGWNPRAGLRWKRL